jgi:hypothetical protein
MRKKVSLSDVPDKKSDSLSEQWTLAVTPAMKRDLQEIEAVHNKNMRKFVRELIQDAINSIKEETKAG